MTRNESEWYNAIMNDLPQYKIDNLFIETPLDMGDVRLVQAGRLFLNSGAVVPMHRHTDFFELTVVTEGEGVTITNGCEVPIKKNDIYVSFPFDLHGIISSEEAPLKYDHLAFTVEAPRYRDALKRTVEKFYDPRLRVISDGRISYFLTCVISEFNKEKYFFREAVINAILSIIIYVVRDFDEKDVPDFFEHASEAEIFCNRLMNYIDANVYDMENLSDLSAVTNYNYNYVSTLFGKTTGMSLRDYFVNKKLEVADALVKEGKLKVAQIAEKLHYSSGNSLSKAYKKKYGVSPTAKSRG